MKCFIQNKGSVFKNNPLKYGNKASCGEFKQIKQVTPGVSYGKLYLFNSSAQSHHW